MLRFPVMWAVLALFLAVPALRAEVPWLLDYRAALAEAKKTGHPMLLAFTGNWSDCARVDAEVFDTEVFKKYAAKHYVLLRLDFSADPAKLPPGVVEQNEALKAKYGVSDFPSFLVLDPQEHVSKAMAGAPPGGAQSFIDALKLVEGN
jgi:thioredoxin-related protein